LNKRKKTLLIAASLALTLITSGCTDSDGLKDKLYTGPELTGSVTPADDMPVIANDRFSLFLKNDMSVIVEDIKNDVIWSTNAEPKTMNVTLQDQFILKYYDASGSLLQMRSKEDCVDKGQSDAFLIDGELYVRYRLGDYEKTLDDVPQVLSNERYTDKFLNKLNEDDAKELDEYYRYYEKDNAWKIKPKGKNNYENILSLMAKAGYTYEDLVQDKIEFGFPTEATSKAFFTVVLKYSLETDSLKVSLPNEFIEFSSDFPPFEISVLESFGQQTQDDEGYIFLPDGSGALMNFSNNDTGRNEISLPVYGLDLSQTSYVLQNNRQSNENVMLPVFGMKDGGASFVAIIEGGESKATINAHKAGSNFSRNSVYTTFRLIDRDRVYLGGNDEHAAKVLIFENRLFDTDCAIRYVFLSPGSDYVDMAVRYRDILTDEGILNLGSDNEQEQVHLLIDTINGVKGYKNFLGISYTGVLSLTSYSEVREIMNDLISSGITSPEFKLTGWFNKGYYHDFINRIKLNSENGGRKEWDKMISYADENGIVVYPDVEFQTFAKGSLSFIPLADSARRLDFSSVQVPVLSLAMQAENYGNGLSPSFLNVMTPSKLIKTTEKFMKKFTALETGGICLRSSGNMIFSDFNTKNTVDRTESQEILKKHIETVRSDSLKVMLNECFAYAFGYADAVSDVPLGSSQFFMADEEVPFLQIVLNGSMTLYGEAMNLASDLDEHLLKSIEYGVNLSFQVTHAGSDELKNTEITTNYSSGYEDWEKTIKESYSEIKSALSGVANVRITDHNKIAEGVYCTVYANGIRVFVNYSDTDISTDSGIIPAKGFLQANTDRSH